MKAYLMHSGNRWFLCFGEDCLQAANGLNRFDIDPASVGVSQQVNIENGKAVELDCSLRAPLILKVEE